MCGIAGIINFDGQPVSKVVLSRMNDLQKHRGPDDSGIYINKNVGLAHRRLSIIDIEGGKQPFVDEEAGIALVYNGEVYNYREIRQELESFFTFKTQSDTEVVLNAYKKWGIDCLQRFRGMFAFALYDSAQKTMYLVRDRLGIKPLYYSHSSQHLIFASEFLPLIESGLISREISKEGLAGYLRYQYVPTPHTIYRNTFKLEPGYYLRIDTVQGTLRKVKYWELVPKIIEGSEEKLLETLNDLLDNTVRMYVRSDVPFGAFLSGGVDSSTVTAFMSRYLDKPVETFSIGYDEKRYSEFPYALEASKILKTNHHAKVVSPQFPEAVLSKIVRHFGEPFSDSSAIPTYLVSQLAARHVKMVLSGDGGDELFGGYDSYQSGFSDHTNPLKVITIPLFRLIAMYGMFSDLKQKALYFGMNLQERQNSHREIFDGHSLRKLLLSDGELYSHSFDRLEHGLSFKDPVTRFQFQDFKTYLVDDILTKVDRMSMANSIEVRVPLLDHKVVEFAFSLPLSMKLRKTDYGICTKYLLKKSAERFFRRDFLERPKMGFGIPVVEWTQGEMRPLLEVGLRDRQNEIFNWVDYKYVQGLLDRYFNGDAYLIAQIWNLWMLDLWMRNVHMKFACPAI